MKINIHLVDAFTDQIFKGNSAAVVITEQWLDDELMQSIAFENNLSETAFLVPVVLGQYQIRWFSPLTEVDFCGHATLASSSVIFEQQPQLEQIIFTADAVGELVITHKPDGLIEMQFPNLKPQAVLNPPQQIEKSLLINCQPVQSIAVLKNRQAYVVVLSNPQDILTVEADCELLKQLAPLDVVVTADVSMLQQVGNLDVTNFDIISRYFWPANGGAEDPVTGSIHAALVPYWAEQLGKQKITAYQASKRGGTLYCELVRGGVMVSGYTRKYLQGEIIL
ncbi:PhzF family phenazine biosynthesis protein [Pelagibaculum spongiae]|uniref:Phenazine biosynthesis protein PhzF n=1 Tax=Pelagibaculum spongiae TaxID=2080658 RepID=A0A2V1H089_9GAMM|nr:PhzF family phenazine biosynthesis protein [Pelagibaculum spongiae]PVZ70614.1 phenazine biosynthesis protein PhzF [Pelagibaculum spongiae]